MTAFKYVEGSGCSVESIRGVHTRSFSVQHVSWITLHNVLMSDICRVPGRPRPHVFIGPFLSYDFRIDGSSSTFLFDIDSSVRSDRTVLFKLTAGVMWRGIVSIGSLNYGFVFESGHSIQQKRFSVQII